MKKFVLLTKTGEVINNTSAFDEMDAAEKFATLKKITVDDLLNIYSVELFV